MSAIEHGLRGATYNIVYPPGDDEASLDNFEVIINPQSFRLPFGRATWSPKLADQLSRHAPVAAPQELVNMDAEGVPRELNTRGIQVCDEFAQLQEEYVATELVAPYFLTSSLDDPAFETSLLCGSYLAQAHPHDTVYAGVMLDASHLTNPNSFERIANRLTSPDAPECYILDIDTARSSRRPLRNGAVLSRLKELFDALDLAGKYSLMVRCDLEALLLNAVSGLDAFAIGYYHSDRQSLHSTLVREYEVPGGYQAPTPYVFSPLLLTDIPRDVSQAMIRDGKRKMLSCGCGACDQLAKSNVSINAAPLCAAHFYASLTKLADQFGADGRDFDENARELHRMLVRAERNAADIVPPAGTFAHLRGWRKWLENQFGID